MRPKVRGITSALLALALTAAGGLAACQGCQSTRGEGADSAAGAPAPAGKPTLRLYLMSTIAGALEPCGCSKDQLGGVDHLAAYLASQKEAAPESLVVAVGPLFFESPQLKGDQTTQATWKAEALAAAAKRVGLTAFVPGANDWAAGKDALAKLREEAGAEMLAGNLEGEPPAKAVTFREAGGVKVALIGVADPKDRAGAYPEGVRAGSAEAQMRRGIEEAKGQGARVLVGLAALPRGEALRLADKFPELHVLAIGKPHEAGDANDAVKPPVLAGSTLVVETSNHLQTVAQVDLFIRGDIRGDGSPVVFADSGGVAAAEDLVSVSSRIRDLETRINSWEKNATVRKEDLAARKQDLENLRAEKAKLEVPKPPPPGSFFRYQVVEVREKLGVDPDAEKALLAYYKRVNEHNKEAFKDRRPVPAEAGQASYLGTDACTDCHDEERKVWDATPHARAYATLEKGFKEFNLDCVSCHVTGYGKPGGSTVTWNDKLQNVQCEECHGPGSLHAKDPGKPGLIVAKPTPESCVSACHHPPHVENFDAAAKMKLILGPGHGM